MPTLIVSSRYTTDSQILRRTAQEVGWETLRLDGRRIPDWFDPPDEQIALFYTAPDAFEIAAQLSRTLLGCNPDWTTGLPEAFLRREIQQMTLEEALSLRGKKFVKHAVSKAFPAAVYDSQTLADAAVKVPPNALVHVCEPVEWLAEYRCFTLKDNISTICLYRRGNEIIEEHSGLAGASASERDDARSFAESVLRSIECPPAFVLDIGMIKERGWAVVEFNECWASGIYACDPKRVLDTLLGACMATDSMTIEERRWDFRVHYFAACG